jgi:2'-5' RNA ligase
VSFRAFISADIVPSEDLVGVLRRLANSRADLKTVRPELMHLTLKFLGEAEESQTEEIVMRIAKATEGLQPFRIKLKGMGAFPSMSNIRVVWVGIEDGGPLEQIARDLDGSMSELGFDRDKRGFRPHLTLARTRSARNIANVQEILMENAATDYGEYIVNSVLLKKSVLTPSGPIYSTVRECRLGLSR